MHCESLPPRTLHSRLAVFDSWGSQMELADELEMPKALSQLSAPSSSTQPQDPEAHSVASSAPNERITLGLSSFE